ncbi:MAG: hypothetical protein F6K08_05170 [Okeania sp. SIO1H6]|nr:hypothetical protein [Okeania sp. SIO1H6]
MLTINNNTKTKSASKKEQFFQLKENRVLDAYARGSLNAKGAIEFWFAIRYAPGWKATVRPDDLRKLFVKKGRPMGLSTLMKALWNLQSEGLINWTSQKTVEVEISANHYAKNVDEGVKKIEEAEIIATSDSQNLGENSSKSCEDFQDVVENPKILETENKILWREKSEGLSGKGCGNSPDLTDLDQNKYKQQALVVGENYFLEEEDWQVGDDWPEIEIDSSTESTDLGLEENTSSGMKNVENRINTSLNSQSQIKIDSSEESTDLGLEENTPSGIKKVDRIINNSLNNFDYPDDVGVAMEKVEALGIEWKLVQHDVKMNLHHLDKAIQAFKEANPFNPVGYFKAALRNRYEPASPQQKTQSQIDMNIQVREKLSNDWWEELGKLWSQRDQYLSRRGNIIEFLKDGTADMLQRLSQMQPQEFVNIYYAVGVGLP